MKALLAFCVTSVSLVADVIREKDRKLPMAIPLAIVPTEKDKEQVAAAKVVLFSSIAMLKSYKDLVPDDCVVIVFDSPINVCGIKNIQLLDCEKNSVEASLSYRFQFTKPKYNVIFSKLKAKTTFKLEEEDYSLLPTIIETKINGGLMQYINNLIYNSTNPTNRVEISHLIYLWSTGALTAKGCIGKIKKLLVLNGVRLKILSELQEQMVSDYGKNIIKAMKERDRLRAEKKPVPYTKLEKDFHIKRSDLKGLVALE